MASLCKKRKRETRGHSREARGGMSIGKFRKNKEEKKRKEKKRKEKKRKEKKRKENLQNQTR